MQAVAEGTNPTMHNVAIFHDQIRQKQIKVLVYNTQAVSDLAAQFQTLAQEFGIPVVGVTATLVRP